MKLAKLSLCLGFLGMALVRVGYGQEPDLKPELTLPELKKLAEGTETPPDVQSAIVPLPAGVQRASVRLWATARIGEIKPAAGNAEDAKNGLLAIEVLAGRLKDEDPQVQSSAAEGLGRLGPAAREAAKKAEQEAKEASQAAEKTEQAAKHAAENAARDRDAAKSTEKETTDKAEQAAKDAAKAEQAVKDADDYAKKVALEKAKQAEKDAAAKAKQAAKDAAKAQQAAQRAAEAQQAAKRAAQKAAEDAEQKARHSASLDVVLRTAIEGLTERLENDRNSQVQTSAATALTVIGPTAKDIVPQIVPRMIHLLRNQPNVDTRCRAAQVLGGIGPAAEEDAKAALKAAIGDQEPQAPDREPAVRVAAAEALRKVSANQINAISSLKRLCDYEQGPGGNPGVKKSVAEILGRINLPVENEKPLVTAQLRQRIDKQIEMNKDGKMGFWYAGQLIDAEKKVVADFEEAERNLEDANRGVSYVPSCLEALGEAIPVLLVLLKDDDPHVRCAAIEALGHYGAVVKETRERYYEVADELKKADERLQTTVPDISNAEAQRVKAIQDLKSGNQRTEADKRQIDQAEGMLKAAADLIDDAKKQRTKTQIRIAEAKEAAVHRTKIEDAPQFKTVTEEALTELQTRLLTDPDWTVRQAAWDVLVKIRTVKQAFDETKKADGR